MEWKPLVGLQDESGPSTKTVTYSTVLGRGAFAAVYKAKCGELPCAAKILYSIFAEDPGVDALTEKFYQECDYLKQIKHPNVVQYLGVCRDPETQRPVLLMEMMDQSLTHFLERSNTPLPRRVEVSLCHDVVLALEYLHSINIVHRDLSSNNVLLIGPGSRAKVSDFGMSKVIDTSKNSYTTPLTQVPGTVAYMPHEALGANPKYTENIDIFSFGVLAIQIMTRQFPNPTDRFKEIEVSESPVGTATVPVEETECRKEHIGMIDKSHPLLSIALACLSLRKEHRPSASDLCHSVECLKENLPVEFTVEFNEPNQLLEERVASLEQELKAKAAQCLELERKLKAMAVVATEKQELLSSPGNTFSIGQWRKGSCAPGSVDFILESTTVVHSIIFAVIEGKIYEYNIRSDEWVNFPYQLIRQDRRPPRALTYSHYLGSLLAIIGSELYIMQEGKWSILKSFLMSFSALYIFSYDKYLIFLKPYEVAIYQRTKTPLQKVGSIQIPKLESASACICNDILYFSGTQEDLSVYKIDLGETFLERSTSWFGSTITSTYTSIAPLQVARSTLVSYNNRLLSVGGYRDNDACGDIFLYEEESNRWVSVGNLPTPRYRCLVEVVENQLVVIGGWLNQVKKYDLVEIATLKY